MTSPNTTLSTRPWLAAALVDFLDEKLKHERFVDVFEYGCGGSTLWFAERCKEVASVEHDLLWFKDIHSKSPRNVKIDRVDLGKNYITSVYLYHPDLVLIDGRNRKACAQSVREISPDAIIWDDAQREYYQCTMGIFDEDYKHRDFVCDVAAPKMARLFVRKGGRFEDWI